MLVGILAVLERISGGVGVPKWWCMGKGDRVVVKEITGWCWEDEVVM